LIKAGTNIDIVLRGNAVNYVLSGQDATGIRIGERTIDKPRILDEDLRQLTDLGSKVRVVREDMVERGIAPEACGSFELIGRAELAGLLGHYDQIWHW
jgi:hypothetical protein